MVSARSPVDQRNALRNARRAIAPTVRMAAAEAVAQHVLHLPFFPMHGYIAGYWAMDGELPLHVFQLRLSTEHVYCLPVLQGDVLGFAPWRSGDPLVTNRYGIPEPDVAASSLLTAQDMALIVLPLTGFDAQAHRLGMGGGWYDRSLAFRASGATTPWLVGVGFDVQEVDAIVPQSWDIACDAICTESRTLLRP